MNIFQRFLRSIRKPKAIPITSVKCYEGKQTIEVDAIMWDGQNTKEVRAFAAQDGDRKAFLHKDENEIWLFQAFNRFQKLHIGDYLVRHRSESIYAADGKKFVIRFKPMSPNAAVKADQIKL